MKGVNSINLIGNLTKDCEVKKAGETTICKFNIAVNRGNGSEKVDFIPVSLFGKYADSMSSYLLKGKQVYVQGTLRTERVDNEKGSIVYFDVAADNIVLLGTKQQ